MCGGMNAAGTGAGCCGGAMNGLAPGFGSTNVAGGAETVIFVQFLFDNEIR